MIYHITLLDIHVVTALICQFFWKYTPFHSDITLSILPKCNAVFCLIALIS